MRKIANFLLFIITTVFAAHANSANNAPAYSGQYVITYPASVTQGWKLDTSKVDAGGYTYQWESKQQGLTMQFSLASKQSPLDGLKELVQVMKKYTGNAPEVHILSQTSNDIFFTTQICGLSNTGKRLCLWQANRVIKKPDGLYSMLYFANPDFISKAARERMLAIVRNAKITKNNTRQLSEI